MTSLREGVGFENAHFSDENTKCEEKETNPDICFDYLVLGPNSPVGDHIGTPVGHIKHQLCEVVLEMPSRSSVSNSNNSPCWLHITPVPASASPAPSTVSRFGLDPETALASPSRWATSPSIAFARV